MWPSTKKACYKTGEMKIGFLRNSQEAYKKSVVGFVDV